MIEKKISSCLKTIFKKEKIPKKITNLKYGNFKSWDSLNHLNLLLTIEKKFKIRFALNEMYELRSVKEIIKVIEKKQK
jgi:acyl carrier protein|tara:strand:- start:1223 stop:1456 length:234 start_codon:yes stop_codon:yes gene_type:complete